MVCKIQALLPEMLPPSPEPMEMALLKTNTQTDIYTELLHCTPDLTHRPQIMHPQHYHPGLIGVVITHQNLLKWEGSYPTSAMLSVMGLSKELLMYPHLCHPDQKGKGVIPHHP